MELHEGIPFHEFPFRSSQARSPSEAPLTRGLISAGRLPLPCARGPWQCEHSLA
jgi:hypothetical protein